MAAGGAYSRGAYSSQASSPVFGGTTGEMPGFPSLPLASCFAAGMTALSACAALIARERDGGLGQRVEIPLSDALLEGSGILTTRVEKQEPMRGRRLRAGTLPVARDGQVMCFTSGVHPPSGGPGPHQRQRGLDRGRLGGPGPPCGLDPAAPAAWRAKLVGLFATRDADEVGASCGLAGDSDRPAADHLREWLRGAVLAEAAGCVIEQDDDAGHPVRTLRQAVDFAPTVLVPAPPCPAGAPAGFAGLPGTPPLRGMRVLDLCRVVAAPTVTRLLTDLGADVIKVDVDPAEARSAYDEPLFHVYLNRGKRGVILNHKAPADRQRFDPRGAGADMLVTNVSAGRLSGTGLSDDALGRLNPALVFSYLNLYGVTGPWADFKGYAEIWAQLRHRRLVTHRGAGRPPRRARPRSTTRPGPTPTRWPACSAPSGPSPPSTTAAAEAVPTG